MGWKYHWKELSQDGLLRTPDSGYGNWEKWENFSSEDEALEYYKRNAVIGGFGEYAGQPIQGWQLVLIKTYEHDA